MESIPTKNISRTFSKMTRKRTVMVTVLDDIKTVAIPAAYWDGGSRDITSIVTPDGRSAPALETDTTPGGYPRFEPGSTTIQPGRIRIQSGTFCGKPATLKITCHRADLKHVVISD